MRNTIMLVMVGLCVAGCAGTGSSKMPDDFEEPAACRTADTRRCAEELARLKIHHSNTTPEERQVLLQEIRPETENQSAGQILKQRGPAATGVTSPVVPADSADVPAPIIAPDLPGELTAEEQQQVIEAIQKAGPSPTQEGKPVQQMPPLTFPKPGAVTPSMDEQNSPFNVP